MSVLGLDVHWFSAGLIDGSTNARYHIPFTGVCCQEQELLCVLLGKSLNV